MLGDIEVAKFKGSDLIVVGPPASEAGGLRPEDWYAAFHALTDDGGPGVTIDPGPNPELMSVRFFGGIENTALGNTFFEADRALKLMSTGFDNTNCSRWSELPRGVRTELDLMGDEVAAGEGISGAGQWHRFWFEPNEQPLETEGNSLSIPLERLIVKDESIPAGRPSPKSATQFAHAITSEFSHLQSDIPAFAELQRDAALVMLAKWVRDKQLPVEEDWLTGDAPRRPTPSTTPGVTVMRARVTDRFYLRYGIHGGVDFQRSNRYGPLSPRARRVLDRLDATDRAGVATWSFDVDGERLQAVRMPVTNPATPRRTWNTWERLTSKSPEQPSAVRLLVPASNFVVRNETGSLLTLRFTGPFTRTEHIGIGQPTVLRVVPGTYQVHVDSKCGNKDEGVTVTEGDRHEFRYWCEEKPAPPPPPPPQQPRVGDFVVTNNTGAALTVNVGGRNYAAAPGSTTIQLPVGTYTATVTSRCGTRTDTVTVAVGVIHTEQYSCATVPAVPDAGGGTFVIVNNTGAPLTVSVGGKAYSAAPGSSSIRLAPGNYQATITTRCGVGSETLNIENGTTFTGQYSCVRK